MGSVITIAGEKLFAAKAQANQQLDIDTFIFANVPGQDPTAPIDREEPLPPQAQIVHQQVVQQVGRINENVVVYSTVLDSVTGPFEFNWVGLYSSVNQTLVAINHVPTVAKTVTGPGVAGNTLNRNFGIEYSGIADLTGITVAPETWQLDFTARLSGMDELTRQLAADMNGKDWFIGEGFKVVPSATPNSFLVTPGVGYVSGLRIELEQEHIINVQTYPQFIYVDAWFAGDANSMWKPQVAFTVSDTEMDDYIDVQGVKHYVYKLAVVNTDDDVVDLRSNTPMIVQGVEKVFSTVNDMLEGKLTTGMKHKFSVGDQCSTGAITWRVTSISTPMTLMNFAQITKRKVVDFIPVGVYVASSEDIQLAIDSIDSHSETLSFEGCKYALNKTINISKPIYIDFSKQEIKVKNGFVGNELFRVGFASGGAYIAGGGFNNLNVTFETDSDIDLFYFSRVARWYLTDMSANHLPGTVFNEASIGHEISVSNFYASSADILNGAGFWINFTDSIFQDLKAIGFSEYGIVNDGADNRYYGCHPWSYPRNQPGYTNFTTKILFYDREDAAWSDCYADTFERENPNLPPSFENGGIAWYFDKVSGIARMSNCGFYALDQTPNSLIGIAAKGTVQQVNVSGGYVLGLNPQAYKKFVETETSSTAVNLSGCNFSEEEYQAKEKVVGSALVSKTDTYIKTLTQEQFNTFENALKTWKKRRNEYSTLTFLNDGVKTEAFFWDVNKNKLVKFATKDDAITTIVKFSDIGIDDQNAPVTKPEFFRVIVENVKGRGLIPCKFAIKVSSSNYPNITSNIFPFPCVFEGTLIDENTFTIESKKFAASGTQFAAYEKYNNTFHEWS